MKILNRSNCSDLRGAIGLAVDATIGVTNLVEKMHHTVQLGHSPVGPTRADKASGITGLVYRSIRGVTRTVGKGLDAGLAPMNFLLPESASPPSRDAIVSAVNGLYGDHLVLSSNPLAMKMSLRYAGEELDPCKPVIERSGISSKNLNGNVILFIHGLCLNEGHWMRDGFDHSQELAEKLGFVPVYLRYNTGLPISENGEELASLLETLLHNWPCPVTRLVIVAHSMGGLVARSAAFHGSAANHLWFEHLSSLVFMGTPHHGAPLERGGNWLDSILELSPYAAPFAAIGKKRSAGINDLRCGSIIGQRHARTVPLPVGVNCYTVAATLAKNENLIHRKLVGDGLVPVDSACGVSGESENCLSFPTAHQWLAFETGHMELLSCTAAFEQLHTWLKEEPLDE